MSFSGNYPDWRSAQAASTGYDSDSIFDRVLDAARKVKNGEALWERGSVPFNHEVYNFPLLFALMSVAAWNKGKLRVLDFSGAFGSTYWQHRCLLQKPEILSWNVVEQSQIVSCGQKEFQTKELQFWPDMQSCAKVGHVDIVLFSSVLQYIEEPYKILEQAIKISPQFIVIDRTPFAEKGERITVQTVPKDIYTASYPCRWLDKTRVMNLLEYSYHCLPQHSTHIDPPGFSGVVAVKKVFMLGKIKQTLRSFIATNLFHPTFWGFWVNPFWLCRRELCRKLRKYAPNLQGKILDFGCGTGPYRALLTAATDYIGLEYDSPENRQRKHADIYYDGLTIPLEDASLDGVLSTQTLEHVPNPERIVAEWARVLRPGGNLLLTLPFMWPEHEMPYDFQRYTTNGLRAILEKSGFEIIAQERLLCDCRAPAQLFLAWLYDSLQFGSRKSLTQLAMSAILFAPVSLLATLLAAVMPATSNTYLDNLIWAKRVSI